MTPTEIQNACTARITAASTGVFMAIRIKRFQLRDRRQIPSFRTALYEVQNIPSSQMTAMTEYHHYSSIPEPQIICNDGLMLLSAILEPRR